ncbi:hypothetical protein V1512DRAFT_228154 [Lipomyces arxii]|uniref:uncharacterized protein n=1 Tax=Lipomyces arxii TaxID=56418 RepID=UPI0034CE7831
MMTVLRAYTVALSTLWLFVFATRSMGEQVENRSEHTILADSDVFISKPSDVSPSLLNRIIWCIPNIIFHVIAMAAFSISAFVVALLGSSFSITLSFYSLLIILITFSAGVYAFVRYRYLNVYSRLPPESHRQEPKLNMLLYPNNLQQHYEKPGFSSYLDEFLSGIKVFGYLEKPVFNELTRHVQTRKLIAGDTMALDEEKGFCIVVDGDVQIFSKDKDDYDMTGRKYELLTEVKNGAPMSSLFTILELFTEDIKVQPQSEISSRATSTTAHSEELSEDTLPIPTDPLIGNFESPALLPVPSIPPLSEKVTNNSPLDAKHEFGVPEIVARASVDSTIAVIPAEAFRCLTRKYPKSATHIVQVILARFERVTFQTGHHFLGLTLEILKTEVAFNNMAEYDLPNHISEGVVSRLKDYFEQMPSVFNNNGDGDDEDSYLPPTQLHVPKNSERGSIHPSSKVNVGQDNKTDFNKVLPGDLVSNALFSWKTVDNSAKASLSPTLSLSSASPTVCPLARAQASTRSLKPTYEMTRGSELKDFISSSTANEGLESTIEQDAASLKAAVLECIFKAMGVLVDAIENKSPISGSAETSPRMAPYEVRRGQQRSIFSSRTSNFSSISPFEFDTLNAGLGGYRDDESVVSSVAHQPAPNLASVQKEMYGEVEILHYKAGATLARQGKPNRGLFYVIDGFLEVTAQDRDGNSQYIYTIKPGGIGGYLGSISGHRSFVNIRATSDVYIGFLPKSAIERSVERHPRILLAMAKRLISLLSKLILHLDFALEWVQVDAGEILYRQGEMADSIYIVLNGRMRAIKETKDGMSMVGEYGQNDSVGELEVLTHSQRPSTLHAVRETEVVRFSLTVFESLGIRHPEIMLQISRIIAARVNSADQKWSADGLQAPSTTPKSGSFKTVAIVPITAGLPAKEFGSKLARAFSLIDQTNVSLDQTATLKHLGKHSFNKFGKLKLSGYLTDLEERYQKVIYIADTAVSSAWTTTCISQADCILWLADANGDPTVGEYENLMIRMKTSARQELVLLHPDRYVPPGQTNHWLKDRSWIHSHHHVQLQYRATVPRTTTAYFGMRIRNLKNRVQSTLQTELQKYSITSRLSTSVPVYYNTQTHKNDFARLARLLSGKAVGLVLGGGGARGLSHLGVIRAIEEAGIPVDLVGGTSIGSFVGGLYARDGDLVPIYGRLKKFAGRIGSLWRLLFDLTYPATSYTTGHEFNRGIWKAFGDSRIEDFWLQYYTNTTNITHSRMEIHSSGYAWRYIRASMSLAGLLPPITDDGSMLLDGGYVDNLPVSYMKMLGTEVVFAVDVGSVDDTTPMTWGDSLSGLWVVWNRWNIFSRQPNVPSMADIQARLAYVSSVEALEKAKNIPGCIYLRPPIDKYATLEFNKFEEIYDVGYQFTKAFIANLQVNGDFPKIAGLSLFNDSSRRIQRRNSV